MAFFAGNNSPPVSDEIEPGTITETELADNSVTKPKIADSAVGTDELEDNAVTEDKIADDAVTEDKIADDAVTSDKISDNAVGTSQIADNSVTQAKLANISNNDIIKGKWLKISPGAGTGPLAGYFQSAATVGTTVSGYISGNEQGLEYLMPDSNEAGGLIPLAASLFTSMNLTIVIRWQSLADNNSENMWIGLVSDLADDMTNSGFPDSNNVFIFGKKNGESNWGVIRNDGSGTATKSNTVGYNIIVNKTTITTTSTTLTLQHNSDPVSSFTTDIPASTVALALVIWYNAESSTDKTFRILDVDIQYPFKTGA